MKAGRFEIALLVAGLAVLAILTYGREATQRTAPPSVFSTYDTGPNGYRALYEVLRAAGVPLRRQTRTLALLDRDVRTLAITGYESDPHAKPLDEHDAAFLREFVRRGGRLVAIDADFAGKEDVAPAVGTTVADGSTHAAHAVAHDRYTAGVARVAGPIGALFRRKGAVGTPLLANPRGIVATLSHFGKGEVVAIAAPAIFGNAHLHDADNAAFAYNVLAGHGAAAFDEYVHGYDDDLSFWAALPPPVHAAVWILCAIVVLALVGANIPFAPPVALEPPDERESSAYLDAMATLMRRAGAARVAIGAFAADARRRARRSERPETTQTVAELERLQAVLRPTDAMLVRAAALDTHLRKDEI